ncbi:MAG: hypothetical protein ACLT98_00415 [Eggerthellaceae bacterium]
MRDKFRASSSRSKRNASKTLEGATFGGRLRRVFVDGAHYFKNLAVSGGWCRHADERRRQVRGPSDEVQYLRDNGRGNNIVFAARPSRTDVSTTCSYLSPNLLDSQGLELQRVGRAFGESPDLGPSPGRRPGYQATLREVQASPSS